jgi:hypothetical protein
MCKSSKSQNWTGELMAAKIEMVGELLGVKVGHMPRVKDIEHEVHPLKADGEGELAK